MSEKDSETKNTNGIPMTRHPKGANPPSAVPMARAERPVKNTSSALLGSVTPESALTAEQKQPLSAREKPKPSEAVFPRPLPARSAPPQTYTQLRTAELKSVEPMKRYEVQKSGKTASQWRYTDYDKVATSSEARAEDRAQSVPATVVKMPVDKKPIVLSVVAVFLALVVILGCIFGIRANPNGGNGPSIGGNDPVPVEPSSPQWSDPPAVTNNQTVVWDTPDSRNTADAILVPADPDDPEIQNSFVYGYASNSAVGFSSEVVRTLDSSEIVKPVAETANEGLSGGYPSYGSSMGSVLGTSDAQKAKRAALVAEAAYLCSSNTVNGGTSSSPYNMMDAEGNLWYLNNGVKTQPLDKNGEPRKLYQHTASVGMYGGNVSESEPRIVKEVTMRARGYDGYGVTGLYAPAGEVIKIEIDARDMNATGGLIIHIGQALYNGQANNIWVDKNQMQRLPVILNTMVIDKNTATYDDSTGKWTGYVGSFLGGPLYIRNESVKFTATVSGCVRYSHFILGYTTEAEFAENAKSSAPYFDLEVWDKGVLHSGPKSYTNGKTYEDLYKAAVLWEKVATVTTTGSNQGIVFIYDPFVAAGAAVAFPGRRSVNCPTSWMSSSLNYNGIVTSGSWGNFHEYHHNFQGYGVGNGGEVTNNGLTLVSYALFTKISAARGLGNIGAQGLDGWNRYTSATWALEETLKIAREGETPENGNQGLALYATLLHNFGADNYIKAKVAGGGQSYAAYMNAWQNVTHNNMYYYFNDILKGTQISDNADDSYPMFVPVSCVYQTGRSYIYDGQKKYIQTMRPYVIPFGDSFDIDLSRYTAPNGQYRGGTIVMPGGFDYRIKSVSNPSNGTIEIVDNYRLKYTPDRNNPALRSGQIVVTLQIVKTDGAFEVEDVDLVLEFEQSHETNKMTLERTVYTFDADHMYDDAADAFNAGYSGYRSKTPLDHSNPTQNCNTDIWLYPDTEANRVNYPNAPDHYFANSNRIDEIVGKLYFDEAGKYRIYLRGRTNCAVYYSKGDQNHYQLGAAIKELYSDSANFHPNDENTYFDLEFKEDEFRDGGIWVYVKEVLVVQSTPAASFIGLGMSQWTQTMFTITERYFDRSGNELETSQNENYQYTETTYNDAAGNPIAVTVADKDSAETQYYKIVNGQRTPSTQEEVTQLTESRLTPPSSASYVNAYRSTYEFTDNTGFETEFFYRRTYNYNYTGDPVWVTAGKTQTPTADCNYREWPSADKNHDLNNLFDGDNATGIHFASDWGVSASKPAILAFDIGETVTANSMVLYTYLQTTSSNKGFPSTFKLEGSLDGVEYFEMGKWTNLAQPAVSAELTFYGNASYTFRYYRLTVTGTANGRCALNGLEFRNTLRLTGNGANHIAPDNPALVFSGDWRALGTQSTFGYAYLGKSGCSAKFEIIGTRLAILANNAYGKNYEVYIDGQLCPSVAVKASDAEFAIDYISQKLGAGTHKVEIRCTGEFCLDSIAIYSES